MGGPRKGFHAVALRGGAVAGQLRSRAAEEVADWCRSELRADLIRRLRNLTAQQA